MASVSFYGVSDDLVEIRGNVAGGLDEVTLGSDDVSTFVVGGLLRVHAAYTNHGMWAFGVSKVDEDIPFPDDWTITVQKCDDRDGHSVELVVVTPGDGKILVVEEKM